jgi:hypothetical protein
MVVVLDPAVGTGTFLLGAAAEALRVAGPEGTAAQQRLIRDHLLPDFYGFELLPAPYAVAHLKVGSFFDQRSYKLTERDHAHIYLTNTLQPDVHATGELPILPIFTAITDEAMAVANIKRKIRRWNYRGLERRWVAFDDRLIARTGPASCIRS